MATQINTAARTLMMAKLATLEAAKVAAEAAYNDLKATLLADLLAEGDTQHRDCWGLASVCEGRTSKKYTSKEVKLLEVKLKAAKAKAEINGECNTSQGDPYLRVTWAK